MNKKRFTLVELIVSVIILALLSSIVVVKILDYKNESISAAINTNTKIIQTAVDKYMLDNTDSKYPTKNNLTVNIGSPRVVDVEFLMRNGYLKKELDLSKVKNQNYWIDVFGVVWGSTTETVSNINIINTTDKKGKLTFSTVKGNYGYKLYEVKGYNGNGQDSYKMIREKKLIKKLNMVEISALNEGSIYLVSSIDKFGLETAPVGLYDKGKNAFEPIIRGEKEIIFEIEGNRLMNWIDFQTLELTPGTSKIEYSFSIKDSNGVYKEFKQDYFSLESSKGIKVKIKMTGDSLGNKPSLFDLRVIYCYEDCKEQVGYTEPMGSINPDIPAKEEEGTSTEGSNGNGGTEGGNNNEEDPIENDNGSSGDEDNNSGSQKPEVVEDINADISEKVGGYTSLLPKKPSDNPNYSPLETIKEKVVCGSNSNFKENTNGTRFVIYSVFSSKEKKVIGLSSSHIPDVTTTILNTYLEYSNKGLDYVVASTLDEIPEDSCINIVYEVEIEHEKHKNNYTLKPQAPTVSYCLNNCSTNVKDSTTSPNKVNEDSYVCSGSDCGLETCEGCTTKPNTSDVPKTDPILNEKEWINIDTLAFFANGTIGKEVTWLGIQKGETIPKDTRIIYRFSTSSGDGWTTEIDEISKVPKSKSLMVKVYLQRKKTTIEEPTLNSLKILSSEGLIDLSLIKPSVAIVPIKSNNKSIPTFSNTTKVKWEHVATDPQGVKIETVEWGGDIKEEYAIGTYSVKVRVKNENQYWSSWTVFSFQVFEEKPVAVISTLTGLITIGQNPQWSSASSYDSDGDGISAVEWVGDKKDFYDDYKERTVRLRVKDTEGNWSNWTEKTFSPVDKTWLVHRLEAEDSTSGFVRRVSTNNEYAPIRIVKDVSASGGEYVGLGASGNHKATLTFSFFGSGLDIKAYKSTSHRVKIDGIDVGMINQSALLEVRDLEDKAHTLTIEETRGGSSINVNVNLDYIDVYSKNERPELNIVKTVTINPSGLESSTDNISLVPNSGIHSKTYFKVVRNSTLTIKVKNSDGKIVRNLITNKSVSGGTIGSNFNVVWDGKNDAGEVMPTGEYFLLFNNVGLGNKNTVEKNVKIDLDTSRAAYRIEAESTDYNLLKIKNDYNGTYSGSATSTTAVGASNGKVMKMKTIYANRYYYSRLVFNIVGDGFDLKIHRGSSLTINIDGVQYGTLSSSANYIYSVRGLPEGEHNIEVVLTNGNDSGYAEIDYLDVFSKKTPVSIEDMYVKSVDSFGNESKDDNNSLSITSLSNSRIYFRTLQDSYVNINVLKNGKSIRTVASGISTKGGTVSLNSVLWNGKDDAGNSVSTGKYQIELTALGYSKKENVKSSIEVFVENEPVSYRIEAEDNTYVTQQNEYSPTSSDRSTIVEIANVTSSNGKHLALQGDSFSGKTMAAHLNFNFVGSGIDVKTLASVGFSMTIDGNKYNVPPSTVNGVYSIRDLSEGNHVVKITVTSTVRLFIDYFDIFTESKENATIIDAYNQILDSYSNVIVGKNNSIAPSVGVSGRIQYELLQNSYVDVTVKKGSKVIKNLAINKFTKGGTDKAAIIPWDGKDNNNDSITTGYYTVEILSKGTSMQAREVFTFDLYVDNSFRKGRYQAEDTTFFTRKTDIGTNSAGSRGEIYEVVNAAGDGGKYLLMMSGNHSGYKYAYLTSTFEGTGLDIKFISNRSVTITVDGVKYSLGTNTRNTLFSLRGLPKGTHSVLIQTGGDTSGPTYIDYMDIY